MNDGVAGMNQRTSGSLYTGQGYGMFPGCERRGLFYSLKSLQVQFALVINGYIRDKCIPIFILFWCIFIKAVAQLCRDCFHVPFHLWVYVLSQT